MDLGHLIRKFWRIVSFCFIKELTSFWINGVDTGVGRRIGITTALVQISEGV
jgi:hypothetical protein